MVPVASQEHNNIKAVLLDWDDTCVNTIEPIWLLHKFIAKTYYDKELADEEIRQHWGKPLHELVKALYDTSDHELAFQNILKHRSSKQYYKKFFAGVPELLKWIAKTKELRLVTAHVREMLKIDFEYLDFDPSVFGYLQTSDETEHHKPDPLVFAPALSWLSGKNILPEETLYVGDSFKDHQAAVNAGLQFVGVSTGLVTKEDFKRAGVHAIDNLFELEDYLKL